MSDEYDNSMRNRGLPNKPHEFQPQEYARDFCAFQPSPESPRCNLSQMNTIAHSVGDEETTKSQSTTEETLLPCPFCGKEAKGFWDGPYLHISGPPDSLQFYSIVCNACCSTAAYESKDRAVNAWNTRTPASAAPVVDNERCYCQCHFQVTIRQDSCSHCDKCVMCGHAMQVDVSGFCVEMVLFGQGGDKTDFVRCGCQCASATQYTTAAAATTAPVEQSDSLLAKITQIADIGSAEEFGDAIERLRAIRKLIATADEGAR